MLDGRIIKFNVTLHRLLDHLEDGTNKWSEIIHKGVVRPILGNLQLTMSITHQVSEVREGAQEILSSLVHYQNCLREDLTSLVLDDLVLVLISPNDGVIDSPEGIFSDLVKGLQVEEHLV